MRKQGYWASKSSGAVFQHGGFLWAQVPYTRESTGAETGSFLEQEVITQLRSCEDWGMGAGWCQDLSQKPTELEQNQQGGLRQEFPFQEGRGRGVAPSGRCRPLEGISLRVIRESPWSCEQEQGMLWLIPGRTLGAAWRMVCWRADLRAGYIRHGAAVKAQVSEDWELELGGRHEIHFWILLNRIRWVCWWIGWEAKKRQESRRL